MLSREMPLVNLWPLGLSFINTKLLQQLLFYFLLFSCHFALSLFAFNLVASKNKGSDNPLAFVGCKQIICLCAGTANVVSLVTPSGSINLGS